jgi:hypothetical protein
MAQVVECLICNCKAPSSNSSLTKKSKIKNKGLQTLMKIKRKSMKRIEIMISFLRFRDVGAKACPNMSVGS